MAQKGKKAKVKVKAKGKQNSAGEAKKKGKTPRVASMKNKASISQAQDNKRGNIGPSGQGAHRGREAKNKQSKASGIPSVPSIGGGTQYIDTSTQSGVMQ